jgi:hypothetical protein
MTNTITNLDDRRPNTTRCYLVAIVDTSARPPTVVGTTLYSEAAVSIIGAFGKSRFVFDVVHGDGHDFEAAKRAILEMPMPYRSIYQWAIDMLPEGER